MTEINSNPQGVVKKNKVRSSANPAAASRSVQNAPNPGSKQPEPKVRIVEQHPTHAVVEVTCSCGRTTYVNCQYATSTGAA